MTDITVMAPMIGVLARPGDYDAVREFFELFKVPWEFCRRGRRYQVVLQADNGLTDRTADLVLLYGSEATSFDHECRRLPGAARRNTTLFWSGESLPLYGRAVPFAVDDGARDIVLADTRDAVVWAKRSEGKTVVRIGYDLFSEIRHLLTSGQPPAHAGIATLERHIALLRACIVGAGIPVVEIPPVPAGHRFIVCLTHDLDHPSLRFHGLDHTTFGFLYRAVIGSIVKACRGRLPLSALWRNVSAAFTLPFVHLGWAHDFWFEFDRYLQIEKGLASTFFVIPVKGDPGRTVEGLAPSLRASAYAVSDIADRIRSLASRGSEVGVHGIDAWLDSVRGSEEREAVARATGAPTAGVRMHWLYFDAQSPARLEQAGFAYDSTFGYNETVGFRAGTLQAFRPLTAKQLLELPLHVMDTALFYPSHLNLTPDAAKKMVLPLFDQAEEYGGALMVNWHDRSIAPERLWDSFYRELLDDLKRRNAWFPTAAQAVAWFHHRRAVRFELSQQDNRSVRIRASALAAGLPGLTIRTYKPQTSNRLLGAAHRAHFTDATVGDSCDTRLLVSCP
jgi:hypothetical protein